MTTITRCTLVLRLGTLKSMTPPRDQPLVKVIGCQLVATLEVGLVSPKPDKMMSALEVAKHDPKFDMDISRVSFFTMVVEW